MKASLATLSEAAWDRLKTYQKAYHRDLYSEILSQIRSNQEEKRGRVSGEIQRLGDATLVRPRIVVVEPENQTGVSRTFGDVLNASWMPGDRLPSPSESRSGPRKRFSVKVWIRRERKAGLESC